MFRKSSELLRSMLSGFISAIAAYYVADWTVEVCRFVGEVLANLML
jgi:hypothetical protein